VGGRRGDRLLGAAAREERRVRTVADVEVDEGDQDQPLCRLLADDLLLGRLNMSWLEITE
jgi:hypothetical protein